MPCLLLISTSLNAAREGAPNSVAAETYGSFGHWWQGGGKGEGGGSDPPEVDTKEE